MTFGMCKHSWIKKTYWKALGVGDNKFELCSGNVNKAMVVDWTINIYLIKVEVLLENVWKHR